MRGREFRNQIIVGRDPVLARQHPLPAENLDRGDLLYAMRQCPEAPHTACPSPAQYLEAFDCGADELYVVTLSALLSGSHNAAAQARSLWLEDHPGAKVHVFNSCSASAGEVLVALKIQELAQAGVDFTTVVDQVSRYISEMETYFVLETLDNLRKAGRLTRVQSIVTSTLRIKLLMGATPEGEICKKGQAMSVKQALNKMVALMADDLKHVGKRLSIVHCNCLERAFYVKELAMRQCRFGEILISDTGGISTMYANDGGIVVAY